jgi:hypothetical protein
MRRYRSANGREFDQHAGRGKVLKRLQINPHARWLAKAQK